jgi:stage V sporulation protein D (sporulation-specific penicillin-binding protein)
VGAVLSDILPYLGVQPSGSEAQTNPVIMPNLVGLSQKEAFAALKELGLTALQQGDQSVVTAQIPAPGQTVPCGSQVLLYFGETVEAEPVKVPDFSGMNRQQASDTAGKLGLYILVAGNPTLAPQVIVMQQNVPPGTEVAAGTTITLTFADPSIRD